MSQGQINRYYSFKSTFLALFLGHILFSCKPSVEELGNPPSGRQKEATYQKAISYQGVTFEVLDGESGSNGRPTVKIQGDFAPTADFASSGGDFLAIHGDSCQSRPVSDYKYYDANKRSLNFNLTVILSEYKQHLLKIGIHQDTAQGKRLLQCLDSAAIAYLYHPAAPASFSVLQASGHRAYATVEFTSFASGVVTHLQLFSDAECSQALSDKRTVSEYYAKPQISTRQLSLGDHKIYARVWGGEVASPCSTHFAQYRFKILPVANLSLTVGSSPSADATPTVRLSETLPRGQAQLFLDSTCQTSASAVKTTPTTAINMETQVLPTGAHKLYAKIWNQQGVASECSTSFLAYTVLGPTRTSGTPAASTTKTTTIQVTGTSTGGYAQLFGDAACTQALSAKKATTGGTTTLTSNTLTAGKHRLFVKLWDGNGVASCSQNFAAYEVLLEPVNSIVSQSGAAGANARPTFQVSPTVSGGKAQLFFDSSCTQAASAEVSTSGTTATISANSLAPGTVKIYARAKDSQGNVSACSRGFANYTLYSPIQSVVSQSGTRGANTTPTFQISPTVAGTKAQLFSDSSCTHAISSKISALGTATTITTNTLPLGAVKIYARIEDSQRYATSCSTSFAGYTVSPSAVNSIVSQSGSNGVDTTPSFSISPTVSGGKAQLFSNSGCTRAISGKIATSGTSSTVSTNTLPAGAISVYARVEDSQGNASACSTVSATYTVLLSTTVSLASLSGTEGVDTTPSFKVTPTIAGGRAQLFSDSTCTRAISGKIATSGSSATVSTNTLPAGAISVYARVEDSQGNASACSTVSATYTVLLSTTVSLASLSGTEGVDTTPSFKVTPTIAGGRAQLFSDASCTQSLSGQVSTSGTATTISTKVLSFGAKKVYAKIWDGKNNTSQCSPSSVNYTVLLSPPTSIISRSGSKNADATPSIEVSPTIQGGRVQLYSDSACTQSISSKVFTAGTAATATTNTLPWGANKIYAKIWDASSNVSPCSQNFATYKVLISPPSGVSIVASTKKTSTPSIQVTGLVTGGQAQLFSNSSCSASLSGKISVTKETQNLATNPLASGTHSLYVKVWDSQGNVSSCAMVYANYTYLSPPTKISIISKGNIPTVGVSGLYAGGKVQLFSDAACSTSLSQKVLVATKTQNLETNPLVSGTHSIYAKAWDAQGNDSQCSTIHASYVYVLAPTGLSVASSDGNTPAISVSGLLAGGHAQLFSDSACSTSLSQKVSVTTATQNLVTTPLASGTHSIYAKSWDAQDNDSICSTVYANYTYLSAPTKISIVSKGNTPTVGVSGLYIGGKVQLFSDSACSTSLSQKVSVAMATQNLETNPLVSGTYNIYAKAWDAQGNNSQCSTAHASYVYVSAPTKISVASSDGNTPIISVSGLTTGGKVQLFSDASCSISFSQKVSVTTETQNLAISRMGTYSVYAKSWDAQDNDSFCSTVYAAYSYQVATPTKISVVSSDGNTPTFSVSRVLVGGKVQLFSDATCSTSVSQKASVTTATQNIVATLPDSKTYSIYAKNFDSQDNASSCSTVYATYSYQLSAPTKVSMVTGPVPVVQVSGLHVGGKVQLFSDDSCTTSISSQETVRATIQNLAMTGLSDGKQYSVYATSWDEKNNASDCSTSYVIYTFKKMPLGKGHLAQIGSAAFPRYDRLGTTDCVLTSSGNVKCWGYGGYGQLGDGKTYHQLYSTRYPVDVISSKDSTTLLGNIVQITSGGSHTCALTSSGNVKCWGEGDSGQLGNGKIYTLYEGTSYPVDVISRNSGTPLGNIVQISSRGSKTCALTSSGNVKCWGSGGGGFLGDGKDTGSLEKGWFYKTSFPVDVISGKGSTTPLANVVQIFGSCALTSSGRVKCWGGKTNYPVDVISNEGSTTPLGNIVQISGSCALTSSGRVKCWGNGPFGRLGDGKDIGSREKGWYYASYPVDVISGKGSTTPLDNIVQISTGTLLTCALTSSGNVKCWGYGGAGQLGDGKDVGSREKGWYYANYPVDVIFGKDSTTPLGNITQISSGHYSIYALTSSGKVKYWGSKYGSNSGKNYPVDVISGKDSTTPLNIGNWKRTYTCYNDGTCEFTPESLIALELKNPAPSASAYSNATPNIRLHHVGANQSVTLHPDAKCAGAALTSGTVAASATAIDLTTDALTAKENSIYAKVGTMCTTNKIPYTYSGGTSRLALTTTDTSDTTPSFSVNLLAADDEISLHKEKNCSDTALASATATQASESLTVSDLGDDGTYTIYLKQNSVCYPDGVKYELDTSG